jgi:hypothetical protein
MNLKFLGNFQIIKVFILTLYILQKGQNKKSPSVETERLNDCLPYEIVLITVSWQAMSNKRLPTAQLFNYYLAAESTLTVESATTAAESVATAAVSTVVAAESVVASVDAPPQAVKAAIAKIANTFFIRMSFK